MGRFVGRRPHHRLLMLRLVALTRAKLLLAGSFSRHYWMSWCRGTILLVGNHNEDDAGETCRAGPETLTIANRPQPWPKARSLGHCDV